LIVEGGRVVGVRCDAANGPVRLDARRGVVLATGGFEWSRELVERFLPAPLEAPGSPPCIEGDGLRMAMAAGAALAAMPEAWWSPMICVPGETQEGAPHARMVVSQRLYPHSIVVNRAGRRFANEAKSYHDFGRDLMALDSAKLRPANRPSWLVYDATYRRRYGTACVGPQDPDPPWLQAFATPDALAAAHGIDPDGLRETLRAWNADVARGRDAAFGRGESAYALSKGDRARTGLARTLGALETPPYYAVPLRAGTLGTRGGPLTDADGRVADAFGDVLDGLFAAGNVAASPTGLLYPGAGGTLGFALTFGWRAGLAAASVSARREA
jgi:3-oxosteroid 1-dehydrogenase